VVNADDRPRRHEGRNGHTQQMLDHSGGSHRSIEPEAEFTGAAQGKRNRGISVIRDAGVHSPLQRTAKSVSAVIVSLPKAQVAPANQKLKTDVLGLTLFGATCE
jgi:hypothetical protein